MITPDDCVNADFAYAFVVRIIFKFSLICNQLITNEKVRRRCGVENLEHRLRKMRLRWFGHVKRRNENNILSRAMELKVEGKRPVGRLKKTWSKIMEKDMRKLNIMEDMTEDRKQWR